MNISNLKIGVKLGIGFGLLLILMTVIALTGYLQANRTNEGLRTVVEVALVKERLAAEWRQEVVANLERTYASVTATDPAIEQHFKKRIADSVARVTPIQKSVGEMISEDEEKRLFDQSSALRAQALKKLGEINKLKEEQQLDLARAEAEKHLSPLLDEYGHGLRDFSAYQRARIDAISKDLQEAHETARNWLVVLASVSLVGGVAVAWVIWRSIVHPLRVAVEQARRVASGDLTRRDGPAVERHDEIGELMQALSGMVQDLGRVVGNVRLATDSIASASAEIASGNSDLSERTEQQASALQETAASMEQITGTARTNFESAQQAGQLAMAACSAAAASENIVGKVVATMNEIHESSRKMADIISVIDGIAFQTNILALNAAVEAARAGEQGRGFSVVAAEVRSLAQRCAGAAKEVKSLIGSSVTQVELGSQQTTDAGSTITRLMHEVKRVSDIVAEIAAASREQTAGIEQISVAITQMDDATQRNAAMVEECSAAATHLNSQAGRLVESVSTFKLS